MNRFLFVYTAICIFYFAVFLWLTAPSVGFFEAEFDISGQLPSPVGWAIMAAGLVYVLAMTPLNTRLLQILNEKRLSHWRVAVLAAAFVLVPGSMGIVLYFLTGNSYIALPLQCATVPLGVYYFRQIFRLTTLPTSAD